MNIVGITLSTTLINFEKEADLHSRLTPKEKRITGPYDKNRKNKKKSTNLIKH
jgi:hypothetical protein